MPKSRLRNFICSEVTYNNLAWLAQQDMVSVANKINLAAKQLVEAEAAAKGMSVDKIPWILDKEGRVQKD